MKLVHLVSYHIIRGNKRISWGQTPIFYELEDLILYVSKLSENDKKNEIVIELYNPRLFKTVVEFDELQDLLTLYPEYLL